MEYLFPLGEAEPIRQRCAENAGNRRRLIGFLVIPVLSGIFLSLVLFSQSTFPLDSSENFGVVLETLLLFILAAIFTMILTRYTPYCPHWWSSEIITPEHIRISGVSRLNKEIPLGPGLEYELFGAENKKDFCTIFFHYGCGRKYAGLHFLTKYESEMIVAYINAAQAASAHADARDVG